MTAEEMPEGMEPSIAMAAAVRYHEAAEELGEAERAGAAPHVIAGLTLRVQLRLDELTEALGASLTGMSRFARSTGMDAMADNFTFEEIATRTGPLDGGDG